MRNGTIRQTIRQFNPANPRKVGDKLLLHGWSGKPYRSAWNWRREEKVSQSFEIECYADYFIDEDNYVCNWTWEDGWNRPSTLAKLDGISPATGIELKHVLESYHGKFTDKPVQMQVIRW